MTTREPRTMSVALPRLTALGWLLCLSSLFTGCGEAEVVVNSSASKSLPTLEAELVSVAPQIWPTMIRSHGSLIPDEVAVVGSRIEGRVDSVHIDLGDKVTTGQTLVTVRQAEFRLRVEQAEAQLAQARSAVGLRPGDEVLKLQPENAPPVLEQKAIWNEAKANMARALRLQDLKSITTAELEQIAATTEVAEARFKSALNGVYEKIALIGVREAELSLAREQLADTQILAPFDGLIQQKQVSPGTYVRVGDAVTTVVRTQSLRFRGTIPERFALDLSPGQTVQLQIESVKEPVTAEISRISPAVDLASRSLLFEAVIDNSDAQLRSGLFAEARIITNANATAIVIPASALVEFAGAEKVWKVVDGESREQQVLTGERRPNGVEILQGLREGDVILRDGMSGMTAKVTPIPPKESVPNDVSDTIPSSGSEEAASVAEQNEPFARSSQSASVKSAAAAE